MEQDRAPVVPRSSRCRNWRGKPLPGSYRTIVQLIAATTTDAASLKVCGAELDESKYPKGVRGLRRALSWQPYVSSLSLPSMEIGISTIMPIVERLRITQEEVNDSFSRQKALKPQSENFFGSRTPRRRWRTEAAQAGFCCRPRRRASSAESENPAAQWLAQGLDPRDLVDRRSR